MPWWPVSEVMYSYAPELRQIFQVLIVTDLRLNLSIYLLFPYYSLYYPLLENVTHQHQTLSMISRPFFKIPPLQLACSMLKEAMNASN